MFGIYHYNNSLIEKVINISCLNSQLLSQFGSASLLTMVRIISFQSRQNIAIDTEFTRVSFHLQSQSRKTPSTLQMAGKLSLSLTVIHNSLFPTLMLTMNVLFIFVAFALNQKEE